MNEVVASLLLLFPQCAPNTHIDTMAAIVRTESNFNQYAIAVVDDYPNFKQPRSFDDAKILIDDLEAQNKSYSVGLAQINNSNFEYYNVNGLDLLEPCLNLKIAESILRECFERSKGNLNDAFSCYYSGNFKTGYLATQSQNSYVATVHRNAFKTPLMVKENEEKMIFAIPSLKITPYFDLWRYKASNQTNFTFPITGSNNSVIKNFTLIK